MSTTITSAEALRQVEAQGVLQPGTEGWWKVWGARVSDIRPGDLVLSGGDNADLIEGTFEAKAAPVRVGFIADGERFTLGALVPVIVLRRSTHNLLAGSVR
jgi:hypothetical protein